MVNKKLLVLVDVFLLVILFASPGSILATAASNKSNSSVGAKASPPFIAYFYSRVLPSQQPNPYCSLGSSEGPTLVMCYTPQDIKTAYNYPLTNGPTGLDGSGQTIVIVDAFGSPTVQSDLNTFDTAFALPPATIQVVCQNGMCPKFNASNPDMVGWTQEIALDTQYAHAMAPGAHIVLFVTTSDDDLVMAQGAQEAVNMFPHSVLSQSWGDPELNLLSYPQSYVQAVLSTSEAAYQQAAREGITVFASTGDWGADNSPFGFKSANPLFPSSSPWVVAVGGTMGNPYYLNSIPSCTGRITCSTGLVNLLNTPSCQLNTETPTRTASCTPVGYGGEQVWNEPFFVAATGGAPSLIFNVPSFQFGLGLTTRATPDVSYNAAIDGGVFGYWGAVPSEAGFYIFGGTSAGSPQWSAIAALADQLASMKNKGTVGNRLKTIGFIDPALYLIGHTPKLYQRDFHDITVGNNTIAGSPNKVGFFAHPGWDDASGWGTPNVANLVPDLVFLSPLS